MSQDDDKTIRWCILGTGAIATDMVQILLQLPSTTVLAVGSRTQSSADRFANRWGIPRRYSSYADATADPDVDVVYVATPSLRHVEDCLLALKNGKAVLCEKSMAPDVESAGVVLEEARKRGLLFVHGVWSRFFPVMAVLREVIGAGRIGEVRSARASFCQADGAGSCSALLETGIYCAQFLQWVLQEEDGSGGGRPIVRGGCRTRCGGEEGNDEHVSALLEFPGKKFGSFECSLAHCSERSAAVYGTKGVIEVPFPFWCPTKIRVTEMTGSASQTWSATEEIEVALPEGVEALPVKTPGEGEAEGHVPGFHFVNSQGLTYEAAEVNRCLREGLTESPKLTSDQCLDILRIISEIDAMCSKGEHK
mmetsp:Transcript_12240/g.15265  ORF Transcript_12240/g.15265 Transcript_12240/m.15265 type:complete len:365 (+) Transcript_12240:157-1251(+)|eukprot:CAMPEP_0172496622 /NCGR_PEP_ID=MMETSP1066-20121228/90300_1 /TAXON_ID=671091 /ORGANISM="Coscinodiscus wailesii, Strain CCMP2513" /LENGTH=364 /DNA_ID=CAMNT_0013269005 /DNA_START=152 /DNA_END=1246 /DNA_ORIENTATION=+